MDKRGVEPSFVGNEAQGIVPATAVLNDRRLDAHNSDSGASCYMLAKDQLVILTLRGQGAPRVDQDRPLERDGYAWRVLWDFRVVPTGRFRIIRGNR